MSAADVLIDKLVAIATANITRATTAALGAQNATNDTISRMPPSTDDVHAITDKPLPSLPAFPVMPEFLNVDYAKTSGLVTADVDKLQKMWIAQYMPDLLSVTSMTSLYENMFNGSTASSSDAKLTALELATTSALATVKAMAMIELNNAVALWDANLTANFATANANIAVGLAIAQDGTQNVAWVVARDQVVREASRNERETISKWAARGFSLPGGVVTKQIARSQQATLDAASQIAAEQAVKTQQLFFDSAKISVDAYMRLMDAQTAGEQAKFAAISAARLRYSELETDVNKYNAKLAFDNLGLRLDFDKFSAGLGVQYQTGFANAMNGLVSAYAGLVHSEMSYQESIARAKVEALRALVDYYRVGIQNSEITLRGDTSSMEKNQHYIDTAANFISQSILHDVQAKSASADAFSRIAGLSLSGLNGVASVNEQLAG